MTREPEASIQRGVLHQDVRSSRSGDSGGPGAILSSGATELAAAAVCAVIALAGSLAAGWEWKRATATVGAAHRGAAWVRMRRRPG
jgi:hypothetical protein